MTISKHGESVEDDSEQGQGLNLGRLEASDVERCMALRRDIYGESTETAYATCEKMLADPLYRHVFGDGWTDSWEVGKALHAWDLEHDPALALLKESRKQEQSNEEKAIQDIIGEIKADQSSPLHLLSRGDSVLRGHAEKVYRQRKALSAAEKRRAKLNEKLTAGSTFGKTKEQIIAEQHTTSNKKRLTVGDLTQGDLAYTQHYQYLKHQPNYVKCVQQRMKDGMTRGQAEAHCLAATLPDDQPTPASKVKK